ncbi:MAG: hypothetical protein ACFFCE_19870 [Promethearchaeota archaeon]
MNKEKSPLNDKFKCPNCQNQFIPESINQEKVINIHKYPRSSHIVEKNGELMIRSPNNVFKGIDQFIIKPNNIVLTNWIITCPECSYISRFIAEEAIKRISEDDIGLSEYNKKFKYFIKNYPKPYKDYTEHFLGFTNKIKNKIINALDEINLNAWSQDLNDWKAEKIESFKFFVRLISSLDGYYKIRKKNENNKKEMPEKIKELNLPNELKEKLINMNHLRNKAVHDGYELNQDEVLNCYDGMVEFLEYIIIQHLTPLNLSEIKIPKEINFLDPSYVRREIWLFLMRFFNEIKISNLKSRISDSILKNLNIKKD